MRLANRFLAVLAVLALQSAVAGEKPARPSPAAVPVGQLGGAVRPLAYRLDLTILPDQSDFSGTAEIDVEIAAPAGVLYLHGNGLQVASAELVTPAGDRYPARYEQVHETGVARLTFSSPVPAGAGTLRFAYTAPFRKGGEGLYRTTVDGESYAFTQFEPIDARRAFPGFDEPVFKTPFDISVTTRAGNTVISNAPVRVEEPAGAGLKRVVFATTKPLPTYLIAFAVGPLDVVEGDPLPPNSVRKHPLPLRAAATRGKGPRLRYALANTNAIVTYLEEYFGREYPYAKLDLIASPEFGTGAMENAGAIIYGDVRLLLADNASIEQQQGFGAIHAHELSHQWFGDLVTPKWWDDTWLNESFASWMGYKAAHAWRPELQIDIVPMLEELAAMGLDSRIAARQIRQPVTSSDGIASSFDGITYLKGSGVLSMFESYLGAEAFREGIRTHMRRFPYAVANVDDFMSSLAQGSRRADVVTAFRSFIEQPGLPIVAVQLDCSKSGVATLRLRQSRYLPLGSKGDPRRTWQIPLCLRYGDDRAQAKECTLLTGPRTTMDLRRPRNGGFSQMKFVSCPAFVMPNAEGAGYYRFALDEYGWQGLMENFSLLTQKEALAAADSLSAAYQANQLSTPSLVAAIRTIAQSPYPQVALAPDDDLIRLRDYLAPASERAAVISLMQSLYRPRLDAMGPGVIDPAMSNTSSAASAAAIDQALFRTNLVRFLALEAGDRELAGALATQASHYIRMGQDGGSLDETAVDPALTEIALRAGVLELGAPFAETLIARLVSSSDARFRAQATTALGTTDDPVLGDRVRLLLLDERLRGREPTTLAFTLAARPSQRRATFDWFKTNHAAFTAHVSSFAHRWLPRFGAGFCTVTERDEVAAFFAPLVGELQGADRTLAETLEGIELCAALADAKRGEVGRYF